MIRRADLILSGKYIHGAQVNGLFTSVIVYVHPHDIDWCKIPDDDPRKATLPLIIDVDGEAVSVLSDSTAWVVSRDELVESKCADLEKWPQFNPVHKGRCTKEDPAPTLERPRKRIRDDSEDDEAVLDRIWAECGPEAAHIDNRKVSIPPCSTSAV
jgi:hypothetical protein